MAIDSQDPYPERLEKRSPGGVIRRDENGDIVSVECDAIARSDDSARVAVEKLEVERMAASWTAASGTSTPKTQV